MNSVVGSERRIIGRRADGQAIKVLLIDDEDLLRKTLRRLLELDGFEVLDFSGGAEGLNSILQFQPSVVVTDIRMPDMDGAEVLARVKAAAPQVAVILLTGHVDPEAEINLKNLGASCILVKPVSSAILESRIREAAGEAD